MDLDRTFCTGLRCKKVNTCDRWTEHLYRWLKKNKTEKEIKNTRISLSQFGDRDGKCDMYSPIKNKKD